MPILNQIHEESEEGGNSPEVIYLGFYFWCYKVFFQVDRSKQGAVVGLGAPAGAAVLRRLEQRRRLHKVGLLTLVENVRFRICRVIDTSLQVKVCG